MNKKGDESTPVVVMTAFRFIVGALIAIVLVSLVFTLTGDQGKKDEGTSYFYFTILAKDLTQMSVGDVKNSAFLSNKDVILVAFDKDKDVIRKDEISKCVVLSEDIKKPVLCRDKNCLCICKSGSTVNCDSKESSCVELPLKVNLLNSCSNFILYDQAEKRYDLELKKDKDAFTINIK